MIQSSNVNRLMRIQARPGSPVERRHYRYPENRWAQLDPDAIAPGIPPDASADLVFHGGKTVPQMEFQNVFLGGKHRGSPPTSTRLIPRSHSRCRTGGSTTSSDSFSTAALS